MAEGKKYRKFSNEEISDPDAQTRIPPPATKIPPPPPLPSRRSSYSTSPSYQPIDESASKKKAGKKVPEEKELGARPKDESARRSFSFVDHVQKNRVDDSSSARKKSASPSMSPVYKNVPERAKVSLNPAGRSSPSSRSPSQEASVEDVPKKGFIRNWFSKAKDFVSKKNYSPLDQDKDDEAKAKPSSRKKDKSKKYLQLDEAASAEKPARSKSFLKRLQKGSFSKIPESASDRESENEETGEKLPGSSSEDFMDFRYAMPVAERDPVTETASDRESEFASSGEFETSTASEVNPIRVTRTVSESSETTTFVLRPELCRIRVNTPADIRVAYSCTGSITTCVSYDLPPASSEEVNNSSGDEADPNEQ